MKKYIILFFVSLILISCSEQNRKENLEVNKKVEEQIDAFKNISQNKEKTLNKNPNKKYLEPTKKEIIDDIKNKFNLINSYTWYNIEKKELSWSSEWGELSIYKKDNKIKKIVAKYYWEMWNNLYELYFNDNWTIFFIYEKLEEYSEPMYINSNPNINIKENRYYFYNNKLYMWLDNQKKEVDKNKFKLKEAELLNLVKDLK